MGLSRPRLTKEFKLATVQRLEMGVAGGARLNRKADLAEARFFPEGCLARLGAWRLNM